ncbi:hypothetical protein G6F32_016466 [Rhizopus arrhizus]|nr:hypothetical protein G6F32_016466 [Rhizopus arrhizus]
MREQRYGRILMTTSTSGIGCGRPDERAAPGRPEAWHSRQCAGAHRRHAHDGRDVRCGRAAGAGPGLCDARRPVPGGRGRAQPHGAAGRRGDLCAPCHRGKRRRLFS